MKRAFILAAAVMLGQPAAFATEANILGRWDTGSEGGKVEIFRCGAAYCGKIVDANTLRANPNITDERNKNTKLRDRKLMNLVVLQNFSGGPTQFNGGPLYDPESGDGVSKGSLKLLSPNRLEVKGCVAVFCRTKYWTRAR